MAAIITPYSTAVAPSSSLKNLINLSILSPPPFSIVKLNYLLIYRLLKLLLDSIWNIILYFILINGIYCYFCRLYCLKYQENGYTLLGNSLFSEVFLGMKAKHKFRDEKIFRVSNRYFGMSSFFNDAIADCCSHRYLYYHHSRNEEGGDTLPPEYPKR
jgi:hypothetical protein